MKMLLLVFGMDSYRRKNRVNEIIGQFKEKHGASGLRFFDTSTDPVSDIVDFVNGRSLFDPLSIAVIDIDAGEMPVDSMEKLAKSLKRAASDREMTVLISSEEDPTSVLGLKKSDLFGSWETKSLEGKELISFISKEAASKGVKLSPDDVRSLASVFNGDLWSISTEIEKLSLSGGSVPGDSYAGASYFSALNAFKFGRSAGEKLAALEILVTKLREDPARIFNGLAYSAPRGTASEDWFVKMADYDIAVKSGKLDYMEVLVDLAVR